jgi:hypothetical protein
MYSNIHYALELIANFCVIILFCIYLCPSDIDSSLGKKFDKWMDGVTMSFLELFIAAKKYTPHCPQQQTNPEILT